MVASLALIAVGSAVPAALVLLLERVLDAGLLAREPRVLVQVPVALVGLYALQGIAGFLRGMLTRSVAWRVVTELRAEVFGALLAQEIGFHEGRATGSSAAVLTTDVESVQYAVSAVVGAVQRPLTIVGLLLAAGRLDVQMTVVAGMTFPLVLFPVRWLQRRVQQAARERLSQLGGLQGELVAYLGGIRTIQEYNAEALAREMFERGAMAQERAELRAHAARLLPSPVVEVGVAGALGVLIFAGGQRVLDGGLNPGELVALLVALALLVNPLKGLAEVGTLMARALAGAESCFAIIDRVPAGGANEGRLVPAGVRVLELDRVTAGYGEAAAPVIEGVSLSISRGKIIAVVGNSGAGKSTLVRLMVRHLDPMAGGIFLDNVPMVAFGLPDLRRAVAIVSPTDFLFDASVAENIRVGWPNAPDRALWAAAELAGVRERIERMPSGWNTRLGPGGEGLSAGERQRICLARGFLKAGLPEGFVGAAAFLVLDEPTAHLDGDLEAHIGEALRVARQRCGVLLITHSPSLAGLADEVVVLSNGRVVERGAPASVSTGEHPNPRTRVEIQ
jgi:subfamily B ATP-binding cassette protein MsbA